MRSISVVFLFICTIFLLTSCAGQGVEVGGQTQENLQIIHLGEAIDNLMDRIASLEDDNRRLQDENLRLQAGDSSVSNSEVTSAPLPTPTPQPVVRTALRDTFFDSGGFGRNNNTHPWAEPARIASATMGGTTHSDSIVFRNSSRSVNSFPTWIYSSHNLNGQFETFTGYAGRVDGTDPHVANLTITGDGNVLARYELQPGDLPVQLSLNVEGVRLLRIEFHIVLGNTTYAIVGFLE